LRFCVAVTPGPLLCSPTRRSSDLDLIHGAGRLVPAAARRCRHEEIELRRVLCKDRARIDGSKAGGADGRSAFQQFTSVQHGVPPISTPHPASSKKLYLPSPSCPKSCKSALFCQSKRHSARQNAPDEAQPLSTGFPTTGK